MNPSWGVRSDSDSVEVACKRLASAVPASEPIAFLKLDIEGMEEAVLADSKEVLSRVEAAYIEVHETTDSLDRNSFVRVEAIMRSAGFQIESESRFGPHALPSDLHAWQRRVGARQSQLLCWRE